MQQSSPSHPQRATRSRATRWLLRAVLGGLATVTLLVGLWFAVTEGFVGRWIVQGILSQRLGASARMDGISIATSGRAVLKGLRLRVPDVAGVPGTFFEARRLEVELDYSGWRQGEIVLQAVAAEGILARISQDTRTERLNIQGWRLPAAGGPGAVPKVIVRSGRIELCEHTGSNLQVLKSMEVRGEVAPDDAGAFDIRFREVRRRPDQSEGELPGLAIGGKLRPDGVELLLQDVKLEDWRPESVPTKLRQLFTDLDLSGEIARTRLQYSFVAPMGDSTSAPATGVAATLELRNVGVSLPGVPERPGLIGDGESGRLMRLQAEHGSITFAGGFTEARFEGSIEGVPYRVRATYKGTRRDSAFEAIFDVGEFELRRDAPVLRFATPLVLDRLQDFGYPTGKVEAQIRVGRAEGGPIQTRGEVRLREGVAAFHRFPYEFRDLVGLVRFTDDEVVIHRVEGRAPSGATIVAEGRIAPPIADAEVRVLVKATNVPMDETVESALGERRARLVRTIFSREKERALLDRGDIRPPTDPANAGAVDASSIDPETPEFAVGGVADITVDVRRALGPGDQWTDRVQVDIRNAGLLVDRFPFPLRAPMVTAVIDDGIVRLDSVELEGLRGGKVVVDATLDARRRPDHEPDPEPTILVEASNIPIDRALVEALPDKQNAGRSARSVVSALGLTGTINARADLAPDAENRLVVKVRVVPEKLESTPRLADVAPVQTPLVSSVDAARRPIAGDLRFTDLTGSVDVHDDQLSVDLQGTVVRQDADDPGERGAATDAPVSPQDAAAGAVVAPPRIKLLADVDLSDQRESTARFESERLDVTLPLEKVLAIVSPRAGADLASLRDRYQPAGRVDVRADASSLGDTTRSTITLSNFSDARVRLPDDSGGVPLEARSSSGSLRVELAPVPAPTTLRFDDFQVDLGSDGVATGRAELRGVVATRDGRLVPLPGEPCSLDLRWTDAQMSTPFSRWLTGTLLGAEAATLHVRHRPEGIFDVRATLSGERPDVRGEITPRSASLTMSDGLVRFERINGSVTFSRDSASFEAISLEAGAWSVVSSGGWSRDESGASRATASLDIRSMGVPEDLKSAAPAGVSDALRELGVGGTGPIRLPDLRIDAAWDAPTSERPGTGRPDRLRAVGRLLLEDAAAQVGVEVSELHGVLDFEAVRDGRDAPLRFDLSGVFERLALAGVRLTDGRLRVVSGSRPGEIFVPQLTGDCHGGRLTASASVTPQDSADPESDRNFEARIGLSGVTLGPMIEDLRRTRPGEAPAGAKPQATGAEQSDAKVDVGFTVAGTLGKPETRRGRGTATAGQGTLLRLPLVTRLAEASNLMLPTGEPLDLMQASFFLQGPTVSFEELSIFSASVEFLGFGTVTWPDLALDMIVTHRAANRVPIVGAIVESFRNELVTTSVTGTLTEPSFGVSSMRGTRGLLDRLFGGPTTLQERRMRELEERGRRGEQRVRVEPSR